MAFRWRKSFTLFPGVRVNLGKSGVSASLGPRGASVNVGPNGSHVNVGLPGTGLSQRLPIGGGVSIQAQGEALPEPMALVKAPPFPWFSKGLVFIALVMCWLYWGFSKPHPVGERGTDSKMFIGGIAFLAVVGALWQWLRYRVHLESVADGTYGQPSFLSRLISGPAVFTGEKGGQYTIGNKGQKIYKKR